VAGSSPAHGASDASDALHLRWARRHEIFPTKTDKLPSGSQWLHEVKHDGFRIIGEVFEVVEPDEPEAAAGVSLPLPPRAGPAGAASASPQCAAPKRACKLDD